MANIFKAKTLLGRTGIFSHEAIAPNLVYNTGDQNISGNKNFLNNIGVSGTGVFSAIDLNNIDTLSLSGVNISIVDGTISLTNRPNVNGTGVVLSGELNSTGIFLNNKINSLSGYINSTDSNIVFTTGIQNIIGRKGISSISGDGNLPGSHPSLGLEIVTRNNMFTPALGVGYGGNIDIVGGSGLSNGGSINLYAGPQANELYGGDINTFGNLKINQTRFNRTINIYKTGLVFGVVSSFPSITIDQNSVSINSPMAGAVGEGIGLYISGVGVTPALYANINNLASTGSILNNKINNLSGYINSSSSNIVFTTGDQTISGTKNFADTGVFGTFNTNYPKLISNPLSVIGSGNTFVQLNIQNFAIGDAASSDLVLTSNAGTDDSFYLDLGINNSGYNQAAYNIGSSGDGYLYVHGGNLTIGTQSPNRTIKFHTDGTTSANQIAEINSTGYFSPNKAVIALSGFFGRNNRFVGTDITMAGGESNIVSGNLSQIVGGLNNSITGCFSNINGGCFNIIHGNANTIGGGLRNAIGGCCSVANLYFTTTVSNFIGGGSGNCISPNQCFNFIGGGTNNRILSPIAQFVQSNHTIILGGASNCTLGTSTCGSILGGVSNCISACMNTVVGGCCNNIGHPNSIIAYGICNSGIAQFSAPAIFIGGINNRIDTSTSSAILGGCDNKICGSCSSIIGGHSNKIGVGDGGAASARIGCASFIGGGGFNTITGTVGSCTTITEYSLIVGGYANKITSCFASILGGRQNLVSHVGATVIGDGGARDKVSRGACSLSLDFNGGIFLTGSNITLSPSPLPGRVDFCDSNLINATPQILTVRDNFNITSAYNSRMILVNSAAAPVTGFLISGQSTGFNASLIQIGAGQIQITGSGIGIVISSYNNQYKTAGQFATISLLHTGSNGYIIYGNTSL